MPFFSFTGQCYGYSRDVLQHRIGTLGHPAISTGWFLVPRHSSTILVTPSVDWESDKTSRARSLGCQGLLYSDFLDWLRNLEGGNDPYPLSTFSLASPLICGLPLDPGQLARDRRRVLPQPIWDVVRANCSLEKIQPLYGLDDRVYDFLMAWGCRLGFNVGFCLEGGIFRYRVLWRDGHKDRRPGVLLAELLGEVEALRLDTLEVSLSRPRERRRKML